ncbi:glycoside hydrolase family 43 protein [Dyadobacter fermentans]|uniref:Glycoside hydrolase family 43 n=1 Tax=Dyadobacter fermentans (strain ATCC 700827 / DSM 18053 / CIP 107007 / KCTC 52180 / NS114) TaxID=471854 RepID=C6W2B0_DYAFD|nr:glycoside hydrolase family 43 protein [Dyadobacter fermentans]ACT92083.1 glycoside hydrolase family 43 [Dyadobacter fermentans DSM 18053]
MSDHIEIPDGNPIIKHIYTADPTVLVHENKIYLYTGHDDPPAGVNDYVMNDWLCFSSEDLLNWKSHGALMKAVDFAWSSGDAYASKVIQKDKQFFWYAAVSHGSIAGKAIGVAVADNPLGPFVDARGTALIDHEMIPETENLKANLDPTVIIDDDGQAYIFWGSKVCYWARLKGSMVELDGPIGTIDLPQFAEGAHLHKRGARYYLSYGYGMPERVAYAVSDSNQGPWKFMGIINEVAGNCETNRPAIIHFQGNDYFFYHNGTLPGGGSHRRSVCVDRLFYENDGLIRPVQMTSGGLLQASF